MTDYIAKTEMVLPFLDEETDDDGNVVRSGRHKAPGDKITAAELKKARQGPDDVKALVRDKAMEAA